MTVAHTDGTQQGAHDELKETPTPAATTPETPAETVAETAPQTAADATAVGPAADLPAVEVAASPEAISADGTEADPVEEEWQRDEQFEAELARGEDAVPARAGSIGDAPVTADAPEALATPADEVVPTGEVAANTEEVTPPADEMAASTEEVTPPAEEMAASTEEVTPAADEMAASTEEVTAPAEEIATAVDAAAVDMPAADAVAGASTEAMGSTPTPTPTPVRPTPGRPTPGRPVPGRPTPGAGPRPTRPANTPVVLDAGSALREAMAFGRVGEDGTVYVRTAGGEREVGTWAPGETEQALAFFARRFATVETEVELAESRARAGALGADATAATAARLAESLATAQVVGDLDALAARIAELPELALERREQRKAEKAAGVALARKAKEELVSEAEQIGQSSTWRAGPDRLRELFDIWQGLPRLDKAADDALWHRFSAARTNFTRRRKAHYSELAEKRVEVRTAKQLIIAEAEKLAESTDWGPSTAAHRDLMTRWKQVGSASKDDDDALWNRFHTARQAFFDARAAHDEVRSSGEKESLAARRTILAEAEALLPVSDLKAARRSMRLLRERWDAVGRVPRGAVSGLDARWKAVEDAVRGSEKQEWRRTDPEARRRAEQAANQLHTSIARLEGEAAAAQARGDVRAATQAREAAAARREWLVQAEKVLTESR